MIVNKRIRTIVIGICIVVLILPFAITLAAPFAFQNSYLPIIYNQPTLTPTSQPPVLFPNGDFEQGPVIWTQYSYQEYPLIYQEFLSGIFPYDGTWAAWLGGAINEIAYIEQQVVVSSDLPYMSYWYWIVPSSPCGNGLGMVLVNGGAVAIHNLCNATGGWVQSVIDLSAYAGQSVLIQIKAECDSINTSDLYVDHVGFQPSLTIANHPPNDRIDIDASTLKQDVPGK
jgi:hypothetical protein